MGRLLQIAVLAVVGYFVVTMLLPELRKLGGDRSQDWGPSAGGSGGQCIQSTARASEFFGSQIRGLTPSRFDEGVWGESVSRTNGLIQEAYDSCSACASASCRRATDALDVLRDLVSGFDSGLLGGSGPPLNAAREQARIDEILDQARALERQGGG